MCVPRAVHFQEGWPLPTGSQCPGARAPSLGWMDRRTDTAQLSRPDLSVKSLQSCEGLGSGHPSVSRPLPPSSGLWLRRLAERAGSEPRAQSYRPRARGSSSNRGRPPRCVFVVSSQECTPSSLAERPPFKMACRGEGAPSGRESGLSIRSVRRSERSSPAHVWWRPHLHARSLSAPTPQNLLLQTLLQKPQEAA